MKRFLIKKVVSATFPKSEETYPTKVVFSNGSSFQPIPGEPEITVTFKSNAAEWKIILLNELGFTEAFVHGEIDIEGENALKKLVAMGKRIKHSKVTNLLAQVGNPIVRTMKFWQEFWYNNRSEAMTLRNLYHHYNMPAEFFHYMNGELYGYTEGYYETGNETQNEAQFKKYDYICRKLRLKKGDKLVEVGTAWGTMALLAARRYGADVTNYGLVPEQNRVLEERIKAMGLQNCVRNVVRDARELGDEREKYDKYVSLGVLEHAGISCYEEWIENIASALKPHGIGVLTFVGYMNHRYMDYFTSKYIWPGCYLPSLPRVLTCMQENGLNMVDIENVRFFYGDTMRVMLSKLNEHWDKIHAIDPAVFDEKFKRAWNLYYTGASEAMYSGHDGIHVFHLVFVKGRHDVYLRTRNFLYEEPFDLSDMHEYEVPFSKVE